MQLVAGTSASAPAAAAMLAAVNDARIATGKSTIGFINPTVCRSPPIPQASRCADITHLQIYSSNFSGGFNDITSGNNPGCGTNGFSAQPGWDPVTGLGTLNFPKLLELWTALP